MSESILYVGTYTQGTASEGLYSFAFDGETGALAPLGCAELENPSYFAVADGVLYAVSELEQRCVATAFALGPQGRLTRLNHLEVEGAGGCHIFAQGPHVGVSNYISGSFALLARDRSTGALLRPVDTVRHSGYGPDADRQQSPHVHFAAPCPGGDTPWFFVADLGLDRLFIYGLEKGGLTEAQPPVVAPPGSGPRHLALLPGGRSAVLLLEMASGLLPLALDARGHWAAIGSPLPTRTGQKPNLAAAIHISPDGRFVCASNRGEDSIARFAADASGGLAFAGADPSGGAGPRSFTFSPDGRFVVVANQDSGNILVFARSAATGALGPCVADARVPSPVCVQIHNPSF